MVNIFIIEKIIIIEDSEFKISVLRIVVKIYQKIMAGFFGYYQNPKTYDRFSIKLAFHCFNSLYENLKWFNDLRSEKVCFFYYSGI